MDDEGYEDEEECISGYFLEGAENSLSPTRIPASSTKVAATSDLSQSSICSDIDILSLSQLTIEEQERINIQPFYNITPRSMPESPHYIFEEEFSTNPWAILIATIFLTKTSGKTARRYMNEFFQQYPTPYHVLDDNPTSLERYFDKLGLRKRGPMIWKLTYQFVSSKWRRASDLCGIGKYGEDAYRIFCLGHTDIDPGDRYLKLYLNWFRGNAEYFDDNGESNCEFVIEDPVLEYYRITLRDAN